MARRTKHEAQATREHLLDTAEQVILARGLSRTSLQDIAQAAGLSRGAIYWHFVDKVALFNAIMDRVDLPLEQALALAQQGQQAALSPPPPPLPLKTKKTPPQPKQGGPDLQSSAIHPPAAKPLAALRTLALAPFALMQRDPRACRAFTILLHRAEFVGELAPLATRQDDAIQDCQGQMAGLFELAAQQGLLAPGVTPPLAATALLALIDGLLRLCTMQGDGALPVLAPAIDALLAGLSGPAAPS